MALRVPRDRDDPVALVGLREDDASGVAPVHGDLEHRRSNDLSALHDDENLIARLSDHRADEAAALVRQLGHSDSEATAAPPTTTPRPRTATEGVTSAFR